ncbi:dihydrolipoamide acetyltransferase family protein [Candidatus Halobonum tyrrellensis]|uniref:Branched-chain alpha-keto acid dehydrogenase subunit E2 n=1 Tax=Candidatus Halobonum tyrrellensis G22 TaxID=1324957 RepID=V4HJ53_9EURY|nr:dihydrolipoamide acetyltransferase family protein [Candidatus Halobonum tyrrellensis]ESP87949.1 branched-chain alpha-keto acid dehydrogenase subunit E2 [Candidatus Halobonum tyrrellensis G22]
MVTKEFELPDVGEGVAEGELVAWLVEPGDAVTEDQPVAEVETDKALVEVPSRYDGTVKELLAEEGETVPVGQVIITFEVDEGDAGGEGGETDAGTDADAGTAESSGDADAAGATSAGPTDDGEETATAETDDEPAGRVFAPPSTRRLARELGVSLDAVSGSGPGGRVTDADVRAHAESDDSSDADDADAGDADGESGSSGPRAMSVGQGTQVVSKRSGDGEATDPGSDEETESGSDSAADAAEPTASAAGRERTLAAPATRRAAAEAGVDLNDVPTDETRDGEAFVTADQVAAYADEVRAAREAETAGAAGTDASAGETTDEAADGEEREGGGTVPYRGVRRTIGERMAQSKYTAPHVTHHDTVVVDDLVETRAALKPLAAERDVSLTYVPFVLKALVAALEEFPILNSKLREDDEEIVLEDDYHVGIAVATDAGLMVPVVRDVDEKSIPDLAAEVSDLAARARSRDLSRAEMQGGTFTVTNFGAIGGEYATPIINHPESAILGLGAIDERPVAEDGEVRAAHTLPLSLSVDHRVVDGADAARFTNRLMEFLADPRLLLLE